MGSDVCLGRMICIDLGVLLILGRCTINIFSRITWSVEIHGMGLIGMLKSRLKDTQMITRSVLSYTTNAAHPRTRNRHTTMMNADCSN